MVTAAIEQPIEPMLPRALIVLDEPFYRHEGRLYCPFAWWRFADRLAAHFEALTLFVPLADSPPPRGATEVVSRRLDVEGRFSFARVEQYYRQAFRHRREMLRSAARLFDACGLVIFRVPSPAALPLARVAWRLGRATALFVGGDVLTATVHAGARGAKAALGRLAARHLRRCELKVAARSAFVGCWGEDVLAAFAAANPRTALAADPSISSDVICRRDDVLGGRVIRIVRVARVLPNKGLEFLLDAVAELRRRGRDVRLDVAGGADDPGYLQDLRHRAERADIAHAVAFHGQVAFGPPLFELYRRADVHVISSLSEGLPRCIVEGRAFGVPTVATKVGSVPSVVHHERDGLLVEPGSPAQIADAVERLAEDRELRRRIVDEGYRLARRETAEFQARRLACLIRLALDGQDLGPAARDVHEI